MKLYTINATPVRDGELNEMRLASYPSVVARTLAWHGIDGFTMYKVDGYWKGEPEVSFKIEIATENSDAVYIIATELRNLYNQDSVMLTLPNNTVEFI